MPPDGYSRAVTYTLLLVEDDAPFAETLASELRELGHAVTIVPDGRAALMTLSDSAFDAVILDRMLPRVDGITVLERLRGDGVTVPVLMLSARGKSTEKVEGLVSGADDYVLKPVPVEELDARLAAIIRGRQWTQPAGDTIRAGDIVISPTRFRVWRADKPIDLNRLEFNLLSELVRNAGTVLTRAMLIQRVWGYDFEPSSNVVDVYIRRLRVKLTADGGDDPIATMRGVGYLIEP